VLLYTDGLVERPGDAIGMRLQNLADMAAARAAAGLEELCDDLAATAAGSHDDVALVAVRIAEDCS
jgi:serine phosphatase RsbU (regulator of sigma subunit)